MPKNNKEPDKGSRELLRSLLKQIQDKIMEAMTELEALRSVSKKRVDYRYVDVWLGLAFHFIELARIVMRKKKKSSKTSEPRILAEATMAPAPPMEVL